MSSKLKKAGDPAPPSGFLSKIQHGYSRILSFPGHVKANYYDGSNKYKTIAVGIGIGTIFYFLRRFYRACKDAGGEERSFIRGFVQHYWVPVLDDFGIRGLDQSSTIRLQKKNNEGRTWHYSEYADFQMDNMEGIDVGVEHHLQWAEGDRNAPPEVGFLLQATRILGQFETKSMVDLWKSVETVTLASGDKLFTKGDPDDQIYILIDGLMEIKSVEVGIKPVTLKKVYPGGQLFSILSFVDVITGNSNPIKTVEAIAITPSQVLKIPSETFREMWMNDPVQMRRSIRRLIRRVYQVVFIALHKVLGLTSELVTNLVSSDRPPIDPSLLDVLTLTPDLREGAIGALLEFFKLSSIVVDPENDALFAKMRVILLRDNFELLQAGSGQSSSFVFVYKGELEVSRMVDYDDREEKEHEQVMFYITAGQGLGGLSYLTDDVNIFTVRVPKVAIIVLIPEDQLIKICEVYPLCLFPIANSVVAKLSAFTRLIDFGIEWIHVNSGSPPIYRVGENADCTYLVLSGRLRSILNEKGKQVVIGEYGKNDWIGLVETLTKRQRSKMVLPVRDSELAKIPEGVLHMIKLRFPIVTIRLLDFLGNRVAKTYRSGNGEEEGQMDKMLRTLQVSKKGSSTIALLPTTPNIPILALAYEILRSYEPFGIGRILRLEDTLKQFGPDALSRSNDYLLSTWLANQEETHGLVIYVAELEVSLWSLRCTRQADTILILACAEESFEISPLENMARSHAPRAKKELVLLHIYRLPPTDGSYLPSRGLPKNSRKWLDPRNYLSFHHHIRIFPSHMCLKDEDEERIIQYYFEEWTYDIHSDIARLTRWISGNSTGLVLGGGGAKGAAHIGILQSILDHGIPIDLVCGVSIGSFVGALYSAFQDVTRVDEYCKDWFGRMTEVWTWVMDLTVPVISILRGEAFNESIKATFGEIQMEDLWLPFFCLSTDVTGSGPRIHRCGTVWRYCRASMTLAGYFPPMCDPVDGHYLMDGGYTNLVPANLMREFGAKFIIAVDVSAKDDCGTTNYGEHLSGLRILAHKFLPFLTDMKVPNLFKLQSQLSFIQSALYLDIVKKMDAATVYLRPPIDEWTAGDFTEYKEMKYTGFRYASEVFQFVVPSDSLIEQWMSINPKAFLTHDENLAEAFTGEGRPTPGPSTSKVANRAKSFHEKTGAHLRRITFLQD